MERRPQQCITLGEAAQHGFAIRILCKQCQWSRIVDTAPLKALFLARRWKSDFVSVSNRMKCRRCGERWSSVDAVADKPDSPPIGPKDDKEYQALLRRLRD